MPGERVVDKEWDDMLEKYIERVPRPVFKQDPPLRTSLEEEINNNKEDYPTSE